MNRRIIFTSFLVIIVSVISVMILSRSTFGHIMSPTVETRKIISSKSFDIAWNLEAVSPKSIIDSGKYNDTEIFIALINNQIIMVLGEFKGLVIPYSYLTSFELESGYINWKTELSSRMISIGNNSKDIVVVLEDFPPRKDMCLKILNYCEAAQIVSYDAILGEKNWSISRENMRNAGAFTVGDNIVSIIGTSTRSSYEEMFSLDVHTGELIDFRGVEPVSPPDHLYDLAEKMDHYQYVIGGIAENEEYVFYLTDKDNRLWAIEKEGERKAGFVQFDGDPISKVSGLKIAANDDFVVVYLGDSQQLFVFRFKPNP